MPLSTELGAQIKNTRNREGQRKVPLSLTRPAFFRGPLVAYSSVALYGASVEHDFYAV